MGGPIVRSGPSQTYTKNWANVFGGGGGKKQADAKAEKGKKPEVKKAKKKK